MFFIEMFFLVLDTDTTNDAVEQLWRGEIANSHPLTDLGQDVLVLSPRNNVDHFHVGSDDVPRVLDLLLAQFALEHFRDDFRAPVLGSVFGPGDAMDVLDVACEICN